MLSTYANNHLVLDGDGRDWIDFRSGIMTGLLGHNSPVVNDALLKVIKTGIVNSYTNYTPSEQRLRERLTQLDPNYTWRLLSTGAEAIDRALQLVSVYYGRPPVVVVVEGGFHGKTMHLAPARFDVPWGNPLRLVKVKPDLSDLPAAFDVLIYEPIQSLTGYVANERLYREACNDAGAYLLADEMVTGFFRTGRRFYTGGADIIVSGKSLGQGLPIAVIGLCQKLARLTLPVDWSTTAAGNNLCTTVAAAVLDHYLDHEATIQLKVKGVAKHFRDIGLTEVYGALAFFRAADPQKTRDRLASAGILATLRDDGVLRLGPSIYTPADAFQKLGVALETLI